MVGVRRGGRREGRQSGAEGEGQAERDIIYESESQSERKAKWPPHGLEPLIISRSLKDLLAVAVALGHSRSTCSTWLKKKSIVRVGSHDAPI